MIWPASGLADLRPDRRGTAIVARLAVALRLGLESGADLGLHPPAVVHVGGRADLRLLDLHSNLLVGRDRGSSVLDFGPATADGARLDVRLRLHDSAPPRYAGTTCRPRHI